jgi:hypothetical protein
MPSKVASIKRIGRTALDFTTTPPRPVNAWAATITALALTVEIRGFSISLYAAAKLHPECPQPGVYPLYQIFGNSILRAHAGWQILHRRFRHVARKAVAASWTIIIQARAFVFFLRYFSTLKHPHQILHAPREPRQTSLDHAVDMVVLRLSREAGVSAQAVDGDTPGASIAYFPRRAVVHLGSVEQGDNAITTIQGITAGGIYPMRRLRPGCLYLCLGQQVAGPGNSMPGFAQVRGKLTVKRVFRLAEKRTRLVDCARHVYPL